MHLVLRYDAKSNLQQEPLVDAVGQTSKRFAMQLSATLVKSNAVKSKAVKSNAVIGKEAKEGGLSQNCQYTNLKHCQQNIPAALPGIWFCDRKDYMRQGLSAVHDLMCRQDLAASLQMQ